MKMSGSVLEKKQHDERRVCVCVSSYGYGLKQSLNSTNLKILKI